MKLAIEIEEIKSFIKCLEKVVSIRKELNLELYPFEKMLKYFKTLLKDKRRELKSWN